MALFKRLRREYEIIQKDPGNISVSPIDEENIYEWQAIIIGPKDTPYEGGIFKLGIKIPDQYPFRPPKVTFETQIFHPNINRKGEICLDILRDAWSSSLTLKGVLLSISSLMDKPNPDDPLMPEIARIYKNDINRFNEKAAEWTKLYAL